MAVGLARGWERGGMVSSYLRFVSQIPMKRVYWSVLRASCFVGMPLGVLSRTLFRGGQRQGFLRVSGKCALYSTTPHPVLGIKVVSMCSMGLVPQCDGLYEPKHQNSQLDYTLARYCYPPAKWPLRLISALITNGVRNRIKT